MPTAALLIGAVWAACCGAGPVDTLACAWLEATREEEFLPADGNPSAFWTDGAVATDSLVLTTSQNSLPGFDHWSGSDDAALAVKAAGGVRGLYVFLRVTDDAWWGDTAGLGRQGDCVLLFHDTLSAAEISTCETCLAPAPVVGHDAGLTWLSKLLTVPVSGQASINEWLELNLYESVAWCGFACPIYYSPAGIWEHLAIRLEKGSTATHSRWVEYCLPWACLLLTSQQDGVFPPAQDRGIVPAAGSRQGFSVGYSDYDAVADDSTQLAWPGGTPWQGQYWGDLVFADGFPPQATPVGSLLTVSRLRGAAGRLQNRMNTASRCYSLTGRVLEHEELPQVGRGLQFILSEGGGGTYELVIP